MLKYELDSPNPIAVHANRTHVRLKDADIVILHATTRLSVGPYLINDSDSYNRPELDEFQVTDGVYKENCEVKFGEPGPIPGSHWGSHWEDTVLKVGREYILVHLGGKWDWWGDESMEGIENHLETNHKRLGLPRSERLVFASGGEVKFTVVEWRAPRSRTTTDMNEERVMSWHGLKRLSSYMMSLLYCSFPIVVKSQVPGLANGSTETRRTVRLHLPRHI